MDCQRTKRRRLQAKPGLKTFTEGTFPGVIYDICSYLSRQEICKFTMTNKATSGSIQSSRAFRPAKITVDYAKNQPYYYKHFLKTARGIYTIDCITYGIHWVHPPAEIKTEPYKITTVVPDRIIVTRDHRWIEFPSYYSEDEGRTWQHTSVSPQESVYHNQTVCCLKDGSLLCTGGSRAVDEGEGTTFLFSKEVWRSHDNGISWNRLPDPAWKARCSHTMVLMDASVEDGVDAHTFGVIVLAGGATTDWTLLEDVWISPDGGVSWSRVSNVPSPSKTMVQLKDYEISYIPTQRAMVEFVTSGSMIYAVGGKPHPVDLLTARKHHDVLIERKTVFWNDVWFSRNQGRLWHKLCHLPWPCVGEDSYRVQSVVLDRVDNVDYMYVSATKNADDSSAVVKIEFSYVDNC